MRVDQFPVGSQLMNLLMVDVIEAARSNQELRHKLFQVCSLSVSADQALLHISMCTVGCAWHCVLHKACTTHASCLKISQFCSQVHIHLISANKVLCQQVPSCICGPEEVHCWCLHSAEWSRPQRTGELPHNVEWRGNGDHAVP